ncbi:MAG: hypothetical protein H7062_13645 [Candidatus Saccharimonas sp.]|nr:hypothetical protein [Planctomycetaceae bacterium]
MALRFAQPLAALIALAATAFAQDYTVVEKDDEIQIATPQLEAAIRKKGYVTGVKAQSFVDRKTGAKDLGFGLDIADWIMEPGSDEAYREQLVSEMVYKFGNEYHGKTPKRSIEGPQICTQAKELKPEVIRGKDFVAIKQTFQYKTAAPGKKTGSKWTQLLVFPVGQRYFISMQRIDALNSSDAMFLRIDMPGHIKHKNGDSFSEVYLSYHGSDRGLIPSKEFLTNFAPDERFNYRRDRDKIPERMIRGYHIRNTETGQAGPWLAGMTLDPSVVSEAWCHQRGYVCLIEEFGERPIKAGESFSAAFIVGFFDSPEEMHSVYDRHKGHTGLSVTTDGWKLVK